MIFSDPSQEGGNNKLKKYPFLGENFGVSEIQDIVNVLLPIKEIPGVLLLEFISYNTCILLYRNSSY